MMPLSEHRQSTGECKWSKKQRLRSAADVGVILTNPENESGQKIKPSPWLDNREQKRRLHLLRARAQSGDSLRMREVAATVRAWLSGSTTNHTDENDKQEEASTPADHIWGMTGFAVVDSCRRWRFPEPVFHL